jgi:hypothetical protein
LTLVIVLIALLSAGTVASADDRRPPRTKLHLTIAAEIGISATATLTCGPAGGSHPNAGAACAELARVSGDLDRLPGKPEQLCTMQYQPVRAAARGHWRGKVVAWQRVFANRCLMQAATGSVFRF